MSLVAYGSSDSDSDSDDKPVSRPTVSKIGGGLFSTLPPPKNALQQSVTRGSNFSTTDNGSDTVAPGFIKKPQSNVEAKGLLFDLPKPKKRTEPVKITIPDIKNADSDSDEDKPVKKKKIPQGSGLSALLPQPKNLVVKETNRSLVPHSLTKHAAPASRTQTTTPKSLSSSTNASPSAIKAAAKSAAMQLARQMAADEEASDEELTPENYFSLGESAQPPLLVPKDDTLPSGLPPPPGTENAPLQFAARLPGYVGEGADFDVQQQQQAGYQQFQDASGEPGVEPASEGYYAGGYYPEADTEQAGSSSLFDDEAFRRLQGKRNQGKEEVKFLEIRGDDQLSGTQQWLTKNLSEEKEQRTSFSKKKGGQPTGQQRRKHQITYLIHQAKERELELKNNWADNKLTRRQTQAKYGF
ncbi:proline-rich protein PRCC [Alosa sapidissima]|uniref:proline-rich protein PRCC n=1 Tax=Alosa sapidissima TaxID=34773 RepID=UPI001C09CC0D|nr:proline-rich protein PRCC [Alosa sapidissima]XP_041932665.1 proline-rich protein PRCC [Alosa sapidissima]